LGHLSRRSGTYWYQDCRGRCIENRDLQ
jgi:hypothetical protein